MCLNIRFDVQGTLNILGHSSLHSSLLNLLLGLVHFYTIIFNSYSNHFRHTSLVGFVSNYFRLNYD